MFAPKVAKPQTGATASSSSSLALHRPAFSAAAENIARARPHGASWDFGTTPLFPPDHARGPQTRSSLRPLPLPGVLQTKLAIGQVDDPLEHEADRAADAVMKMDRPAPALSRGPAVISRKCAACSAEDRDEERHLQAKPSGPVRAGGPAPASVHTVVARPGRALEPAARAFLEPSFGRSFAEVRIHDDGAAAASAAHVGARAYTVGRNIVFGTGEYRPATPEGRRLLAHELTHVVQQGSAPPAPGASALGVNVSPGSGSLVQRETHAPEQPAATPDAGAADAGAADAGVTQTPPVQTAPQRLCGPDIGSSLATMLGTVEPWFKGLTGFQQSRSCTALGPGGFLVGVNPGMAWDTRQLFLPNTGWLDAYFRRRSCGSPRDPGCDTDPQRHLCEKAGTCGNSVVVDSKCMLAGTANYALFGKMCRICHDYTQQWNRWDMRATIGAWKTLDWDDSTPPKEVASAGYDGTFPAVPATAENRGNCTGRCGLTHGGTFDFIWEPYKPR